MGAPESHYDFLRLLDGRLDRGLVALGGPPYGSVVTTDRRFHLSFDGHSWPDMMEPGWEPAETGVIFLGWDKMAKGIAKYGKAVQIAEAVTVMNVNPSFETDTTSWAAVGGAIARTTDEHFYGDYSCEVTPGVGVNDGINQTANIAIAAATDYTVHIWVKPLAAGIPMRLRVTTNAGGNHDQAFVSQAAPLFEGWQFVPITFTSDGADNTITDIFIQKDGSADVTVFYVDMLNVTATSYSTPSADGSLGAGHVWTGAAHASTSTRVAATLTYPNSIVAYPDGDCCEQLTIAGWFIPAWAYDVDGSHLYAWDVRGANDNNRILIYYVAAVDVWRLWMNGGTRCTSVVQTFGSWEPQFVAVTIDFDNDVYKLYVNDEAVVVSTAALTPPAFGANSFYIGSHYADDYQLDGLIDDFVIYPRVLSANEIRAIYKFGNPLQPPTSANMRMVLGEQTSTDFDGDTFSTTGWTTYDLVDGFGIPFGAKAIYALVDVSDSGGGIGRSFKVRKDATQLPSLTARTGEAVDEWATTTGIVPVANGRTVDYSVENASGANSLTIHWRIYVVWL